MTRESRQKVGIFDRARTSPVRSVLIITNYQLAFDHQSRVQKCRLSTISLQDRCERRRQDSREHDQPFHPPARIDPYLAAASPLRRFSRVARVSESGCRLMHPGISSLLSYSERCLQLSSHDMPYYRWVPGDSVCRLSRALLREKITTDT